MDMRVAIGISFCLSLIALSDAVTVCRHDTECTAEQCCYIKPEFEIMSRRRQLRPLTLPDAPVHGPATTGVCENYLRPGDHCDTFAKLNKHCSCGWGTTCRWVPTPTTTARSHTARGVRGEGASRVRRGPPFHLGPGSYLCS